MNAWQYNTNGKPLQTVRTFLQKLWLQLDIDAMMLPLKSRQGYDWQTEVVSDAAEIERCNPFTPIMMENIAYKIPQFILDHPGKSLAVLLRPCELRALLKITEKRPIDRSRLTIISADCLGTFPADEFSWRAERKGSPESLTEDNLQFSRLGGISSYRYRSACQLCTSPLANQADVNINIVGIPIRQTLMVSFINGIHEKFEIKELSATIAPPNLLVQHADVGEKMIFRNHQTRTRLSDTLVENTSLDLESLVDQLNDCGECQICMDVCPICNAFDFHRDGAGALSRDDVAEWMISCIGCGMCEQSCSKHKPLAVIFSVINEQLAELNS